MFILKKIKVTGILVPGLILLRNGREGSRRGVARARDEMCLDQYPGNEEIHILLKSLTGTQEGGQALGRQGWGHFPNQDCSRFPKVPQRVNLYPAKSLC